MCLGGDEERFERVEPGAGVVCKSEPVDEALASTAGNDTESKGPSDVKCAAAVVAAETEDDPEHVAAGEVVENPAALGGDEVPEVKNPVVMIIVDGKVVEVVPDRQPDELSSTLEFGGVDEAHERLAEVAELVQSDGEHSERRPQLQRLPHIAPAACTHKHTFSARITKLPNRQLSVRQHLQFPRTDSATQYHLR